MIDEDVLAELIHQLGNAVTVPPEGPERVLARRAELGGDRPSSAPAGRVPPIVRRHRVLVAAAAILVLVAAVGVGMARTRHRPTKLFSAASLPLRPAAPSQSALGDVHNSVGNASGTSGQTASEGGSAAAITPSPAATPASVPTKVIKTGMVDLRVPARSLSAVVARITSSASGLGGYLATSTTTDGIDAPTGDLTVRVPAAQFETFLDQVRALGTPTSVTTSGQDVTSAYVDLQARITALQASRTQYLAILARATTIGDILAVQQQIDTTQTQLDQLQGQLNVLDDQAKFGSLTIHLSEPSQKPPAISGHESGLSAAWAHARHAFSHGVESVVAASGGLAVFALCVALLAVVAWLIWSVARRRLV